jgi:uridine kinase
MPTRLIGIGGPSCSGKTLLAMWLHRHTGAPVLNLDHYYLAFDTEPIQVRAKRNFDEPAALDFNEILRDARALAAGDPIHAPLYDFTTHTRAPGTEPIYPGPLVILEGLFALYWPELRELYSLSLYVETPDQTCFLRRLERDVRERGRTPESVRWQYDTTVRPMAQLHIHPTRDCADEVVSGIEPIDASGRRVLSLLHL